jgi:hypothetical protein
MKQLRNQQQALPDSNSIDQILARLDRLEKDVQELKEERSKGWWRKLRGK